MTSTARFASYLALGLVAGFLSGLLGVGGGVIIVPALVLLLRFPQKLASGTSLLAVAPISAVGLIAYLVGGHVDWAICIPLAAGTVLGGVLGSWLLVRIPSRVVSWVFLVAMVATAIRMCFADPPVEVQGGIDVWRIALLLVVGVLAGILSGLVGVGGGIILVPALTLALGVDALAAKGASLAAILPNAVVSSVLNVRRRNAALAAGLTIGLAGCVTTVLGSLVAAWIDPRAASIVFAVFLLLVAAQMAQRLLRRR